VPGLKTNEAPGTRAVLRHYRMSAYKARQVLDLIRGKDADRAEEILNATPREAARVIGKVLASAVANARNNDQLDPDELFVSACYADEGTTLKRWRPRARGRATRIRKRTCHITVIVSRLPEDRLERRRSRQATETSGLRSRRVAASRRGGGDESSEAPLATEASAESEVEDLDATSTDVTEEHDDTVEDEDGTAVEGATDVEGAIEVTTDDGEFEEPAWLDEVADTEDRTDAVAGDAEAETEEAEEEAPPASKARRARTARKKTTKAADDAQDSDIGGSGEEEKG
jgi:large subunit ribosomal protein L22